MKVFLSHSSAQKPLVREIKAHLPRHIHAWLDEETLVLGDQIESVLRGEIISNTDVVLLFVDAESVNSGWVAKEIGWALEREHELDRTILLPIVLDDTAWAALKPPSLKDRRYLALAGRSSHDVQQLVAALNEDLFAWLSVQSHASFAPGKPLSLIDRLRAQDAELLHFAGLIREQVHGVHRSNPSDMRELLNAVRGHGSFKGLKMPTFRELFNRLRQEGLLAGVAWDGDTIFVKEEHYSWKSTLYSGCKERIASAAVGRIESGNTIALDAGSTTTAIAEEMAKCIAGRRWTDLTVITNSLPAAAKLSSAGMELGFEDNNDTLKLVVSGGRVRPNTLAVVDHDFSPTPMALRETLKAMQPIDLAFVGTNGIFKSTGFTTHNNSEKGTKAALISSADNAIIVADPSKFGVYQECVFATFKDTLTVLTAKDGNDKVDKKVDEYAEVFDGTSVQLEVVN